MERKAHDSLFPTNITAISIKSLKTDANTAFVISFMIIFCLLQILGAPTIEWEAWIGENKYSDKGNEIDKCPKCLLCFDSCHSRWVIECVSRSSSQPTVWNLDCFYLNAVRRSLYFKLCLFEGQEDSNLVLHQNLNHFVFLWHLSRL